ncbi:helix-turn-helix domain-containing protein [Cyanobacteria bacterium FACHB-472]|nr:helix-turn-helix domain-containing protein [Cyanobacteria bacterium FACHB-472]
MNKKYILRLTPEEKQQLEQLINQGKTAARKLTHARILLKANDSQEQGGWSDASIHQALDVSLSTIARVRQIFVEQGLDAAINPKTSSQVRLRKLDGVAEAHLIACCCSQPPLGRKEWTLRLLADEMVKLEYVDSISHETVRQVLKKTNSSLG